MENIKLIPIREGAVEEVEKCLRKQPIFGNLDQFINGYNEGILHEKNPAVAEMVSLLVDNFVNLKLLNKKIVVVTPTELALDNSLKLLKDWQVIVKLKSLAEILVTEDYGPDAKIVFADEQRGKPMIAYEDINGNEELTDYWAAEKTVGKISELANNKFTEKILKDYDEEGSKCYFLPEDLLAIDDTFLLDIEKILLQHTLSH